MWAQILEPDYSRFMSAMLMQRQGRRLTLGISITASTALHDVTAGISVATAFQFSGFIMH